MTHFRIRYEQLGGHVHCRLFSGVAQDLTHGKCGHFTMSDSDFSDFRHLVESADIEFKPEGK